MKEVLIIRREQLVLIPGRKYTVSEDEADLLVRRGSAQVVEQVVEVPKKPAKEKKE
jgi:uncharacterized protein with PhoU and TrkA domain